MDALPQQVAAAGGDRAKAGVASGLVDKLGSRAEFARMVARLVGRGSDKTSASWSHVKLADYARVARHGAVQSGPGVGVVYVSGEIVDGEAGPGTASGDTIAGLIEEALAAKNVKALVENGRAHV